MDKNETPAWAKELKTQLDEILSIIGREKTEEKEPEKKNQEEKKPDFSQLRTRIENEKKF